MRALFCVFAASIPLIAQPVSSFDSHLRIGVTALQQSRYAEAGAQLHAALTEADRPGAAVVPMDSMLQLFSTLADLDALMGQFDEATQLATRALDTVDSAAKQLRETGSTMAPPDPAPHLMRLASVYRSAGKTTLAIPVLQRLLAVDQKRAADDPAVSSDYDKLGGAFTELKQFADARAAYRGALETRISRLGAQHVDVATAWVNLGVLEQRDKQYGAAKTDFETALAMSEKLIGAENYGLTGILDRMGGLFSEQKRYGEAALVFQRSLAIREKVLGPRHSDLASALENLGTVYFYDEKYLEAEPLFQRELQIYIGSKGPDSPMVAMTLDEIGALYTAQKRYPEAESYFKKALAIREERDIDSLSNLAQLYVATNDPKRAEDYFQRAILIGEKGLGAEHAGVTTVMDQYATLLHQTGRVADAKKMEAHSRDLKDKISAANVGAPGASGASGAIGVSGRRAGGARRPEVR